MYCGGSKRIVRANENYKIITVYSIFESRRYFFSLQQFVRSCCWFYCLLASLSFCFENHDADVLLLFLSSSYFFCFSKLIMLNRSLFFSCSRKMYLFNLLLVYLFYNSNYFIFNVMLIREANNFILNSLVNVAHKRTNK